MPEALNRARAPQAPVGNITAGNITAGIITAAVEGNPAYYMRRDPRGDLQLHILGTPVED